MNNTLIYDRYMAATQLYLSNLATKTNSRATCASYKQVLDKFGKWLSTAEQTKEFHVQAEQNNGDISPIVIIEWKAYITNTEHLKRNTLRYYLIVLKAFFLWTVEKQLYTSVPISDKDIPKHEEVKLSFLSDEEIGQILRYAERPKIRSIAALRKRAIVILLLQSGLRVSELTSLTMGDVDFENGCLTVACGKGSKRRTTTFPALAQQSLREYLNAAYGGNSRPLTAHVFEHDDESGNKAKIYSRQDITSIVRTYVHKVTGRNDIGAHDLRHAYASYLITNGVKLDNIQQLLGHKSYATTVIYAEHLRPKSISAEVNRVFDVV